MHIRERDLVMAYDSVTSCYMPEEKEQCRDNSPCFVWPKRNASLEVAEVVASREIGRAHV